MKRTFFLALQLAAMGCAIPMALVAAQPIDLELIRRPDSLGFLLPIPVHVSGLSGEADSVLKNDLLFMGVVHKPLEEAKFLIKGNATGGRAEARVLERVTQGSVHEAAFTASSQRAAVHALSDSIAKALTGLPKIGIDRKSVV